MFHVDHQTLVDTRLQLHWASQLLSASADAKLKREDDDHQSNLGWNSESNTLESRVGVGLNVVGFVLEAGGQSFALTQNNMEMALNWLQTILEAPVAIRGYEMPGHEVGNGAPFSPDGQGLKAIAEWFTFGHAALRDSGELRVWPHHFDLGFWTPTEVDGRSIGGGFSIGDEHFQEPYFYMNPYGIDRPESFPELSVGRWVDGWTGAVLTATDLDQTDPGSTAAQFISSATDACRQLLA